MRVCAILLLLAAATASAALQSDIEFGRAAGVSLKMDAWVPDGAGPFPTVVIVHGGGWRNGDKQQNFRPMFQPLTDAGFAWFTINYRMWPEHHYPAAVDDLVTAIRFVKAHAREYKVDLRRIAITGESAGGHMVAWVGARYGKELGLAAVVPFYPATDMEALAFGEDQTENAVRAVKGFLGITELDAAAKKVLRDASPVTGVRKGAPPFLLVHGTADKTVPYPQSLKLQAKLKEAGVPCELFAVEGAPHGFQQWEKNPDWLKYKVYVVEWLKRTMK
jgi:acetyl esterase